MRCALETWIERDCGRLAAACVDWLGTAAVAAGLAARGAGAIVKGGRRERRGGEKERAGGRGALLRGAGDGVGGRSI